MTAKTKKLILTLRERVELIYRSGLQSNCPTNVMESSLTKNEIEYLDAHVNEIITEIEAMMHPQIIRKGFGTRLIYDDDWQRFKKTSGVKP